MKKILIITTLIAFMAAGCSKYDEGPAVSFIPKKARLANYWKVDKAYDDGKDVTSSYDQYSLNLNKDHTASLTAKYNYGPFTYEGTTKGVWSFENKKEDLKLDFESDDADATYQILRLSSDELWLRQRGGSVELRLK